MSLADRRRRKAERAAHRRYHLAVARVFMGPAAPDIIAFVHRRTLHSRVRQLGCILRGRHPHSWEDR